MRFHICIADQCHSFICLLLSSSNGSGSQLDKFLEQILATAKSVEVSTAAAVCFVCNEKMRESKRESKRARKRGIAVATCNKLTASTQLPERVGAGNDDDGGGIGTEGGGGY